MKKPTLAWRAAVCCALALSCAVERPAARLDGDPASSALAAELSRLETEVPATPERLPRPDELIPPATFVPREVRRSLTATVCVRGTPDQALLGRETFRLSPEAVCSSDEGGEWWLARNPRHREELCGARTLPEEGLVIHHTAGDLRLTGMEGLWARCAALGGLLALPPGLRATPRGETRFGLEFRLWEAEDEASALREVWWNEECSLALRIVVRGAEQSFAREIETLEWAVDAAALRHPSERHPEWTCLELADWQDACGSAHGAAEHAAHGGAGAGAARASGAR